jgi:hypothetical protein
MLMTGAICEYYQKTIYLPGRHRTVDCHSLVVGRIHHLTTRLSREAGHGCPLALDRSKQILISEIIAEVEYPV